MSSHTKRLSLVLYPVLFSGLIVSFVLVMIITFLLPAVIVGATIWLLIYPPPGAEENYARFAIAIVMTSLLFLWRWYDFAFDGDSVKSLRSSIAAMRHWWR